MVMERVEIEVQYITSMTSDNGLVHGNGTQLGVRDYREGTTTALRDWKSKQLVFVSALLWDEEEEKEEEEE